MKIFNHMMVSTSHLMMMLNILQDSESHDDMMNILQDSEGLLEVQSFTFHQPLAGLVSK